MDNQFIGFLPILITAVLVAVFLAGAYAWVRYFIEQRHACGGPYPLQVWIYHFKGFFFTALVSEIVFTIVLGLVSVYFDNNP